MPVFLNNRYILHESLGQGAMGAVYRATDRLSGEVVAIKRVAVVKENLEFASRAGAKDVDEIKLALAQEFQTLASLRHPNIISVLDYGFDEDHQPFFTMNYLPEAQTIIDACQNLDENGKADHLIRMLQALAYLHRRNILHRDLKPGNVLVTENDLRVLDFGLSVSREQAQGRTGTLAYMAPETIQSGQASEASDLYAIGVIAYRMFAGQLPFEAHDIMGILSRPAEMRKLVARPELVKVIEKLLQKSPADRFKGALETIVAMQIALERSVPKEDSAIRESFLQAAKFIGRETELMQLLGGLEKAIQGQGSIWLVGGESGVGKTRLLMELRIRALVQGANVLRGQATEDKGRPYQIWQEPLRRLALFSKMSDLQAAVLKPIIADIETLLGRDIPEAPELDKQEASQRLSVTIGEVIKQGASASPPLVLLLEDLHWETESLEALTVINRIAADVAILAVVTYRTEETPNLPDQLPNAQKLLLPRFDQYAIAELSASMLGDSGTQPQVLTLLQDETEGNVFFLVETVRALAEEAGGLQSVGSSTLPRTVFTGGVRRIIQRRLDQVPEQYRTLLKIAAIAGRELELELLQHADPNIDLETWLTTCANVAVLEIQDERWRFAHDKLREALLNELDTGEQKNLHNQVASLIETTYSNNLAPNYGRLAWHYSQIGNQQKERDYAQLAGEQAAAKFSHEEALRFFQQAMEQTAATDLSTCYELLLAQESIYKLQGKFDQRLDILEALLRTATELGDPAHESKTYLCWVDYYYDQGNFPAAIDTALQVLRLAETSKLPDVTLKTYNLIASSFWKVNNLREAMRYAETGLELARKAGDKKHEAELLNNQGMIAFERRILPSAQEYFNRSLTIALENGFSRIQANALNNLGMVTGYQGNFQSAQNYYEQALKIARETGARKQEAMNLANLGWVSGQLGEYHQAITYTEENIRIARKIGDPYNETYGLINLSSYAGAIGDQVLALGAATQAQKLARQIGNRSAEAWALTSLGHSYLASKNFEQARNAYQGALLIRRECNQPLLATEPEAGLSRVLLAQGDIEAADQHIRTILPVINTNLSLDGTDDPIRVYLACYLVLNAKNDDKAGDIIKAARDLIQSRAAKIPDEGRRKSFLENIPHHREIRIAWEKYANKK